MASTIHRNPLTDRVSGTSLFTILLLALGSGCPGDDAPIETTSDASTGDTTDGPVTVTNPTMTTPGTGDTTSGVDTTMGMPTGGACGDNVLDDGESCDRDELGGEDCVSQGFAAGQLACADDCTFDTGACLESVCGDDTIQGTEECDGTDLGGSDCVSLGRFDAGELGCADDCTYDTSMCVMFSCGNDVLEGMESCDGADLGGQDCTTQGFLFGTLACDPGCAAFDTTGCTNTICSSPAAPVGPDGGTVTVDTILVPALGDFVTDVNVFTDVSHTFTGDMVIDVHHVESDTRRLLIDGQCSSDPDLLATFDMDLGLPLDCDLPAPVGQGGLVLPEESIEVYSGIPDGASTWELTILDQADGDAGTLNQWCLEFEVGADPTMCGDGVITFGESCDDGNAMAGDGCDDTCNVEFGFDCTGTPSVCVCNPDPSFLRLAELSIGTDYVDITNPIGCAIPLGGLNILFDDSSSPDLDFALPAMDIAPGQTLRVFEPGGAGDIVTSGNIFFDISRGGATLLCTGVCTGPADVIDVVVFSEGAPAPALPAGITFLPAALSGIVDQFAEVYGRVAFVGVSPAFEAADWMIQ